MAELMGWDSIAGLLFLAMADSKLGVVVPPSDLVACKTVEDLVKLFPGKIS